MPNSKIRSKREQGVVAVEFVFLLPVLLILLLLIIQFGQYYNESITVTHAAREAVRSVAFGGNATAATTAANTAASPHIVSTGPVTTCPPNTSGTNAAVTVSKNFTFDALLFGLGTKTISQQAVMRCGG